jgi:hypothetical protein
MLRADWTRSFVAQYFLTTACSRRTPRVVNAIAVIAIFVTIFSIVAPLARAADSSRQPDFGLHIQSQHAAQPDTGDG